MISLKQVLPIQWHNLLPLSQFNLQIKFTCQWNRDEMLVYWHKLTWHFDVPWVYGPSQAVQRSDVGSTESSVYGSQQDVPPFGDSHNLKTQARYAYAALYKTSWVQPLRQRLQRLTKNAESNHCHPVCTTDEVKTRPKPGYCAPTVWYNIY